MGFLHSVLYFTVIILVCKQAKAYENENFLKASTENPSFLLKFSNLSQNSEKPIFESVHFEKSSRNLNVTNTTNSPAWVDAKGTTSVQIYIFIVTLVVYGVLLILSWKKDKREAKEENEFMIKKRGTPIKLEVTKKYIDNNKGLRRFSIIFEDKNKLLGKKTSNWEETEREENDEAKQSETDYERKIPNDNNTEKPDCKEKDTEMIDGNASIEEKAYENLDNQQNKSPAELNSENKSDNKNQNEISENIEGNVSLSFLAPEEVYIYKQEVKKEEKLTYSVFLAKMTDDKPKTSWKYKVKKYHNLLSIFYFKNPKRTRIFAVTLYTLVLIGQMLFLGLFYRDANPSTVKTVNDTDTSTKKKPDSRSYKAEDFFIMIFCVFVMFFIMLIIYLICQETEIKENISEKWANKIKEANLKKRTAGMVICWGLMALFCWAIIDLDGKYEKSVTMVWMTNTIISYVIKIFILSWFEMNIVDWFASLPDKLRKHFERKSQMEEHEIDNNNEAVQEKNKYHDQVQDV